MLATSCETRRAPRRQKVGLNIRSRCVYCDCQAAIDCCFIILDARAGRLGLRRLSMSASKLRRQIAWDAARLMYDRHESEYYRAKMKAARWICRGWVKPIDLPSNAEIRDQIQAL